MIDTIISYLEDSFGLVLPLIPGLLNILVLLVWIFLIRKFDFTYKTALKVFLILLFLSLALWSFSLKDVSSFVAEYAFLFFGIGVVQKVLSQRI